MFRVDRIEFRETMHEEQLQLEVGEFGTELAMQILVKQGLISGQANTFDDDVDEAPVQDLALSEDCIFQADQCNAFDSDVDEAPTAQTMFMVQDHENYLDSVGEYHEVHDMQNDVQPNYVVDTDTEYTSDSNIIPYDQDVKNNPEPNKVVNESLTAELARYKELVESYEKKARFELTEREPKIDEQIRIIITDRNIKEDSLKKEIHSVKMQLISTVDHNKSMKKEVATLKKDFKQKENKYLEDFLDMK
uniref:Retrovirus-related Pol polyprotein from transposon TNT 1-94 n=1 Tax=Tanacetum cinerariifolium TaxID=118510 RepID=A0A6L2KJU1_TANCI|nr:hypothetical protein [Tanacetum cinerariifolium]